MTKTERLKIRTSARAIWQRHLAHQRLIPPTSNSRRLVFGNWSENVPIC
jgi:hypothetical protein